MQATKTDPCSGHRYGSGPPGYVPVQNAPARKRCRRLLSGSQNEKYIKGERGLNHLQSPPPPMLDSKALKIRPPSMTRGRALAAVCHIAGKSSAKDGGQCSGIRGRWPPPWRRSPSVLSSTILIRSSPEVGRMQSTLKRCSPRLAEPSLRIGVKSTSMARPAENTSTTTIANEDTSAGKRDFGAH